jgi:hypothetical protein
MRTFVGMYLVMNCLCAVISLCRLSSRPPWPRTRESTALVEVIGLILNLSLAAWAFALLYGALP